MVSGDLHDLGEGTANQYLTLEYESLSCDEPETNSKEGLALPRGLR